MQSKKWTFTLNNYTQAEVESLKRLENVRCMIFGHEIGENGTPHLQGAIIFLNNKRLNAVRQISPRAHWEGMKGTWEQSVAYCSKEDAAPFQSGTPPLTRGQVAQLGGQATTELWQSAMSNAKEGKVIKVY